jgi:hypothetical protein
MKTLILLVALTNVALAQYKPMKPLSTYLKKNMYVLEDVESLKKASKAFDAKTKNLLLAKPHKFVNFSGGEDSIDVNSFRLVGNELYYDYWLFSWPTSSLQTVHSPMEYELSVHDYYLDSIAPFRKPTVQSKKQARK